MTKDTLVQILQTSDGMRIDMLAAMLRSNDILVATPGRTHNAMVPHWGGVIAIPLLVPEEQAERALQLIAEWESTAPADEASSGELASASIDADT